MSGGTVKWQKGQSGNPNGRIPEKLWRQALISAINAHTKGQKGPALQRLADKLVTVALKGDIQALKEIGDRLDGKPHQTTDTTLSGNVGYTAIPTEQRDPVESTARPATNGHKAPPGH